MSLRYLALDDHPAVAGEVTGQQVETLLNAAKTDLTDSAIHAPEASFGGQNTGWTIDPHPSVDEAEDAVLAIAAVTWDEESTADWLRPRLRREVA